jgi:hypothetical protein
MSMSVRAEVDARDIARVARVLRKVDKELLNDLGRSMRSGIGGTARDIAAKANANGAPLSGMRGHNGNTKWGNVRASVSTRPGRMRSGWGDLVTINVDAGKTSRGMYISEFAGSKNPNGSPFDARGPWFVGMLNLRVPGWDKGGRYVYRAFMPFKDNIYRLAESLVEKWSERVSGELEKY